MSTAARFVILAFAVGVNVGVYALGNAADAGDAIVVPVLLVNGVLAGVLIARPWASVLALSCPVIAAFLPTGSEDSRLGIVILAGVIPGIAQLILVWLGVSGVLVGRWVRRRQLPDVDRRDCPRCRSFDGYARSSTPFATRARCESVKRAAESRGRRSKQERRANSESWGYDSLGVAVADVLSAQTVEVRDERLEVAPRQPRRRHRSSWMAQHSGDRRWRQPRTHGAEILAGSVVPLTADAVASEAAAVEHYLLARAGSTAKHHQPPD
jgi:hypothetical protein